MRREDKQSRTVELIECRSAGFSSGGRGKLRRLRSRVRNVLVPTCAKAHRFDMALEESIKVGDGPARRGACRDGVVLHERVEAGGRHLAAADALGRDARSHSPVLDKVVEAHALLLGTA
jgi:hypothetical protein